MKIFFILQYMTSCALGKVFPNGNLRRKYRVKRQKQKQKTRLRQQFIQKLKEVDAERRLGVNKGQEGMS